MQGVMDDGPLNYKKIMHTQGYYFRKIQRTGVNYSAYTTVAKNIALVSIFKTFDKLGVQLSEK